MKILVSACLLGEPCRYDAASKPCRLVCDLAKKHELIAVCPERLGGRTVPRNQAEIDQTALAMRVIETDGAEVTNQFDAGAEKTLELAQAQGCTLAIFKSKSPSCGTDYVYDGTFTHTLAPGVGVTTRLLRKKGIRVIDEQRLETCTEALFASDSTSTPTLETRRLTLRPITRDDADDIFAYSSNPAVGPNAGWRPHRSMDDTFAFIDKIASSPHVFGIVLKESGQDIGSIGLIRDTFRQNTEALMLGYALGQPWWGKGYMTEASREIIRYGFEDLGLALITSNHYLFNNRSKRVIEKCGFSCEGTIRGVEATPDGIMQDTVSYSLSKEEYFSSAHK